MPKTCRHAEQRLRKRGRSPSSAAAATGRPCAPEVTAGRPLERCVLTPSLRPPRAAADLVGGRMGLLQRLQADPEREEAHREHQQHEEGADHRVEVVVEGDPLHLRDRLGRCDHGALRGGIAELMRQREEADGGSQWKTFWTPAVRVVISSHAVGTSVTQT